MLVQVEIVQHDGVHVHELQRPPRHDDRERRPHAERRREQRQRRRGEDGRRWQRMQTFWTTMEKLLDVAPMASVKKVKK